MKPIAIFRHAPTEGPGYFATFLEERTIPWKLVAVDAGEPIPADVTTFGGLVFMGGPMSVNDDLPWIAPTLALIRQAVAREVPVLGHCLGGQLMAKALGGVVGRNPIKEIGWGEVVVADHPEAAGWFGGARTFDAFHWHGETFSVPPGARPVLSSAHCAHQGFALGRSLALQCHVEMTADMVRDWCIVGAAEIDGALSSPAVQTAEQMQQNLDARISALNKNARQIYAKWVDGLVESQ